MNNNDIISGVITESLPDTKFRVKLDDFDKEVICYLAGKMRINKIRCLSGDRVECVLSLDKTIGRIVRRI